MTRESQNLMQELTGLARSRHEKYGQTIFHLEPNIKDGPGGLRDYQVACWLAQISGDETVSRVEGCRRTFTCSTSLRCRQCNRLPRCGAVFFSTINRAATLNALSLRTSVGSRRERASAFTGRNITSPNDWMRVYFRHARAIYRLTVLYDEVPLARSIWSRILGVRKLPYSTPEFSVVEGRVSLALIASVEDPKIMFRLFELVGKHNLKLTAETENAVEAALPRIKKWLSTNPDLWGYLQRILVLPYAASSLRAMHRLGLLDLLFKEFQYIDSLVIRDYYPCRYTVDERHSLVTIGKLHRLAQEPATWTAGFAIFFPRWKLRNCFTWRCCFTTSGRACRSIAMWKAAWKR